MKFGDLFICRFPFTSGTVSKPRPSLVLFDIGSDVVICRITSAPRAGPLDVVINDWAAAGLLKSSIARLDRLVTAEKSLLHTHLGNLSDADKNEIRRIWNSKMVL